MDSHVPILHAYIIPTYHICILAITQLPDAFDHQINQHVDVWKNK